MQQEHRIETDQEPWPFPYCPACAESIVPKRCGAETFPVHDHADAPRYCHDCGILLDTELTESGRTNLFDRFVAFRGTSDPEHKSAIHALAHRWPDLWRASGAHRSIPA